MRIDAYTHFIPEKYFKKIVESGHADIGKRVREIPCIHDPPQWTLRPVHLSFGQCLGSAAHEGLGG